MDVEDFTAQLENESAAVQMTTDGNKKSTRNVSHLIIYQNVHQIGKMTKRRPRVRVGASVIESIRKEIADLRAIVENVVTSVAQKTVGPINQGNIEVH